MNEKMELDMEVDDLDFEISPFGYGDKDKLYCTLKMTFETNSENMIELLKKYKTLSEIDSEHWQKDEDGDPFYQTDIWNLKLNFLRFERDDE